MFVSQSLLMVDKYLYLLCGTDSRRYSTNVYKIDMKTLESVKLFDSVQIIDKATYIEYSHLQVEYPDDFLLGRYRQEIAFYGSKIYTLGGGKLDGYCFPLNKVIIGDLYRSIVE